MRKILTAWLATAALALPAFAAGPDEDGPKSPHRRGHASGQQSDDGGRESAGDSGRSSRSDSGMRERPRLERPTSDGATFQTRSAPSWRHRGMESGSSSDGASAPRETNKMLRHRGEESERPRLGDQPSPVVTDRASIGRGPKIVTAPRTDGEARPAPAPTTSTRSGARQEQHKQWTRHWRDNHRYDWRHHRERNRSLFRLGIYLDPYGYHYRRWMVGWSMQPFYYRSVYWIDDPWRYRLPETWGPYQWVRYYDDALLVDTWSGEVVDVIYNFFW